MVLEAFNSLQTIIQLKLKDDKAVLNYINTDDLLSISFDCR